MSSLFTLTTVQIIAFIKEDTLDQKKMLTIRRRDHTFITNSAKRGGEQMILPQLLLWKTNTGKEKLMWDIMKHFNNIMIVTISNYDKYSIK